MIEQLESAIVNRLVQHLNNAALVEPFSDYPETYDPRTPQTVLVGFKSKRAKPLSFCADLIEYSFSLVVLFRTFKATNGQSGGYDLLESVESAMSHELIIDAATDLKASINVEHTKFDQRYKSQSQGGLFQYSVLITATILN